jgi:hypothetical protein
MYKYLHKPTYRMFVSTNSAVAWIFHTMFNNYYIVEIYERKSNILVTYIYAID